MRIVVAFVLLLLFSPASKAETPEEWIKLGARVHGGFGPDGIMLAT
jgi:hypothetical protein